MSTNPLNIVIIPASTKVGAATIRALLSRSSTEVRVTGVYRNPSRAPEEFLSNPNFSARQGDVEDAESLDFKGADAVLSITPTWHDGRDLVEIAKQVSENVKRAVEREEGSGKGVKRVVVLSSFGAQYDHGTGAILMNHAAEEVFKNLKVPETVFMRPGYFMENWATAVETVKEGGFLFGTITPTSMEFPHIAIKDIGEACAKELLAAGTALPSSPYPFELLGPVYSTEDVRKVFAQVSGKEVEIREIPKEGLSEFYGAVFPPSVAKYYADMNVSLLEGGILSEHPEPTADVRQDGKTELVEVIRELYGA